MIDKLLLSLVGVFALIVISLMIYVESGSTKGYETKDKPVPQVAPTTPWQPSSGNSSTTYSQHAVYLPGGGSTTVMTTTTVPTVIKDGDLNSLASLVHLGTAKQVSPSKDAWAVALPIARQLLQGPCDCEQRNWLNQFVTMGNYAMNGSPQYYQSAQLMDTLPLSDQNLKGHYTTTN